MNFFNLIFYGCLRLRFLNVETNLGPRRPVLLSAEYSIVMSGAWPGTLEWPDHGFVSVWYTVVLWDFALRYASRVEGAGSRFRSPCLVSWQDASGQWDCIRSRWLRIISPIQIWMWLLRNAGFYGLWCETGPLYVQSLSQPWPRWPDFLLFTIASMTAVQAEDVRACFLSVGDLNGHHQVLRPRTVMELRPLTPQQSLVAISWLSAQPMHAVEHLTSWWLMFLT